MRICNKKNSVLLLLIALISLSFIAFILFNSIHKKKLLIAPMIGGLDSCIFKKQDLINDTPNTIYTKLCLQDEESASNLVKATLDNISKNKESSASYKLGYTLYVPLLKLIKKTSTGFEINEDAAHRISKTIENTDRPVIIYLFSDHFSINSPIEDELAKNEDNILKSAKGPLAIDKYYGANIYPWSFVNTNNEITRLRAMAFNAIFDDVCKLPKTALKRIEGVTMLGELHHMFPNFQAGMGFTDDYLISDYSQDSIKGFQDYLLNKYASIANLNKYLNSNYASFKEVWPPSKNIRKESLNNYWEHIDAYAHGTLPISGWIARNPSHPTEPDWIHIYNNGQFLARVPVAFGRQDVLAAHPELSSADVGWSYNFNYSKIQPGLHTIDIYLERGSNPISHLSRRIISIMDKSQTEPKIIEFKENTEIKNINKEALFYIDTPSNYSSYYYNPLALSWHEFRKTQITKYINYFGNIAKGKCINKDIIYSHQILPFVNPGWDETKFSVGTDLAIPSTIQLGVSLYGEASYGTSFFDWFGLTHRASYGITEFHPLKAMDSNELNSVLNKHYKNNAKFLSFFIESVGLTEDPTYKPNLFSFDKNNKNSGSDVLFESIKEILK